LQGAKSILEKGQKRAKRPNENFGQVLFGTKFLRFGPKRANLATLVRGRGLVDMGSERPCSVTMSDRYVLSHFVIMLDGAGATCSALNASAVLMQHYSGWGAQNRGSMN